MSETTSFPWMGSSLMTVGLPWVSRVSSLQYGVGGIANPGDFLPSTLTGLIGWYDASQIAGVTSGTSLSAWTDLSGQGNHAKQASAQSQPKFFTNGQNGNSIVSWITGSLLTSAVAPPQPYTFAATVNPTAISGQVTVASDAVSIAPLVAQTNYRCVGGGSILVGSTATLNAWVTAIAIVNGSATTFSISNATTAGNVGTTALGSLNIGARSPGNEYWIGAMGELILYNRIITEAERVTLNSYLQTKWATL